MRYLLTFENLVKDVRVTMTTSKDATIHVVSSLHAVFPISAGPKLAPPLISASLWRKIILLAPPSTYLLAFLFFRFQSTYQICHVI